MQVTVETTGTLERKMTVQIPAERIDSEVARRLESMRRRARIDGFRPGKVPLKVIKQRFGKQVLQEVMNEMLQSSYEEAVAQENLRPAGGPQIKPGILEADKGFEYTATFEVYPEFQVTPMDHMEIARPVVTVSEADVDKLIETLRSQRKTWNPVDRPAQGEDQVVIDFEGTIDGHPFKGGHGKDFVLELGSGRMPEGFEDQLLGVRAGAENVVEIVFPQEYRQASVAGKTAKFEVKVKRVAEPVLPAVDDEFVKSFGVKDGGVEAFRNEVRTNMERQVRDKAKAKIKAQVMEALRAHHPIELPEALVQEQLGKLRRQTMASLDQTDESQFPDELFKEGARKRVALGLIVGEIVKTHRFKPEEDEIQETLNNIAASYEDPQQVIQYYRSNRRAMANIEAMVLEDQVVNWVLANANVVDQPSTFDELVNRSGTGD